MKAAEYNEHVKLALEYFDKAGIVFAEKAKQNVEVANKTLVRE